LEANREGNSHPYYPTEFYRQLAVIVLVVGVVISLAVLLPVGYEEEANYLSTPHGVKAEWYFLWLYQMMKLVPERAGIAITAGLVLAALAIPFIDRSRSGRVRDRLWIVIPATVLLIAIAVLTILGAMPSEM